VGQEEGPLSPTEISSLEYESEAESSTESVLSAYQSQPTPPPRTPSASASPPPPPYDMSQPDYITIIRQLQEQMATLTAQLGQQGGGGGRAAATTEEATEVAKPQIFDGTPSKVSGFVGACKIYIKTRLREVSVEAQINWVLSYVQGGPADIWKENVLEELETGEIEFENVGEFLVEIREFRGGDEESVKVAELKKIE